VATVVIVTAEFQHIECMISVHLCICIIRNMVKFCGMELNCYRHNFVCTSILIVVVGGTHYRVARFSAVSESIFSHC